MTKLPSTTTKRKSEDIHCDSSESSSDLELSEPPEKHFLISLLRVQASLAAQCTMRSYKDNLSYDPTWETKYPWMDYKKGMVCTVCKVYEQAKGAWITRPVSNWVKATTLLANHDKSDWHKAAMEKRSLSLLTHK